MQRASSLLPLTHLRIFVQHFYCSPCVLQAAQQDNATKEEKREDNDKGKEGEGEGEGEENERKRSKRSVVDFMQEVTEPSRHEEKDMQSYNQQQPGGEEVRTERPGNSDVRLEEPRKQGENVQPTQEDYERRDPDNQERETIDKDEEEDDDEQDSDLSRKSINKQMAEMQENYNEKRIKEQRQQQVMQILPQEQNSDTRGRSLWHVAPIPAVQRQDTEKEHKVQSDGRLFCQEAPSSLHVYVSLIFG